MSEHKPVYIGIDRAHGDDETAIAICLKAKSRLVCTAVQKEGELQDAIMDLALAAREQHVFTPQELDEINAELDRCRDSIALWLDELGHG